MAAAATSPRASFTRCDASLVPGVQQQSFIVTGGSLEVVDVSRPREPVVVARLDGLSRPWTITAGDGSRQPSANELDGARFLGRHVVRALARRDYRIRVAVRRPELAGHLQRPPVHPRGYDA